MEFVFAQILSFIGLIILILAMLQKKKNVTLFLNAAVNLLNVGTYFLLARNASAFIVIGAFIRTLLFAFMSENNNKKLKIALSTFFSIYFVFVTIYLWKDYIDIILLVNYVFVTYAFALASSKNLKISYIISSCLLLTYNTIVLAFVNAIKNIFQLISSIIGLHIVKKAMAEENAKKALNNSPELLKEEIVSSTEKTL